jgi:hypothetical protein
MEYRTDPLEVHASGRFIAHLSMSGYYHSRNNREDKENQRDFDSLFAGRIIIAGVVAFQVWMSSMSPAAAQSEKLDKLVRAYPEFLLSHNGHYIIWRDGSEMNISDGRTEKTFDERLRVASMADQLLLTYPTGRLSRLPDRHKDPGRFRSTAFFDKMYGDCTKGESQRKLVITEWLPTLGGERLQVTSVNGVAEHLQEVSKELELMPSLRRFLVPSAGAFNCRVIKDTGQRSMHAWGAAIDINTSYSDYWLWSNGKSYRNRIPWEIVDVFERHGFIWGGKWGHFDTMHFEYRPELL